MKNDIENYLAHIARRGFSPTTQNAYKGVLKRFGEANPGIIERVGKSDVEAFQDSLGLHPRTVHLYMTVIRNFFRFVERQGKKVLDFEKIELPKISRNQIEIPSANEFEKFFGQTMTPFERCLVELLRESGLRISEAVSLDREDIREGKKITVKGKGGKIRLVLFKGEAGEAIEKYLAERKDLNRALLVNQKGERITTRSLERFISAMGKRIGISRITPHMLRHYFATRKLNKGMSLQHVQKLLGHSSIQTTENYLHVTDSELEEAFAKF